MTARAQQFLIANALWPVVYCSLNGVAGRYGGQGCTYRLSNGRAFTLTAAECRSIGEPRWARAA